MMEVSILDKTYILDSATLYAEHGFVGEKV